MTVGATPAKHAADMLRQGKGHMPWGQGKLEDTEGESTYSEYFWAKDLEQGWDESSMYAFLYDRPTSIWYYLAIILLPVVVVGACLFPLAPWWARMALVYFLMGLLCLMLGLTLIRYVVFTAVWVVTGHSLWVFPNMMEEQASLLEAFTPIVAFTKAKSITDNLLARFGALVLCSSVVWVLASHSPDMKHIKEDVMQAHDSLFEYLDSMYGKAKGIEGATQNDSTQAHATGKGAGERKERDFYGEFSHARARRKTGGDQGSEQQEGKGRRPF
ncbi:translocation protein Sec62-domain-containing protein [Dunaliella salina]|uniref:Translocation protein SEC62 n=2 Tax=Dunaliella salina TaxID=3046 RepID=A0ABQ7GN91_DUNSA|nr:translocation protein Sec62-domain-containing protein [Dunaliella salina]|eukprot:KAF5836044.1 translocation protein Sec62-domain-containing protein [Dunaliella salina]